MEPPSGPPRVVGKYAIFGPIASGGMATVHLGRLLGSAGFSRTVAIKRLHENLARDPDFAAMFLDEARLAARIRHPNVVPTLDVVRSGREILIVMEYVSGEPLSLLLGLARAGGRPPPIPVVVDIVIGVLHGLHAAHEATNEKGEPLHIVHRDVSPQNIVVGTDGVARVLDFGVAKAAGRMRDTQDGQVKGKVRYMPLEQITGKGVTRSADVYAASVILWEALTGRRRFEGENDAEVMYNVLLGGSEPPSVHRPDVPPDLDAIVLQGMGKDPGDRFETALAMANALEVAVPPARRGAVAAWVMESARDDLELRRQRVARVESDATVVRMSSMPPPPLVSMDASTRTIKPSVSSAPSPRAPARAGTRWRPLRAVPLGVIAAASLAGATAIAILVAGRSSTPVAGAGDATTLLLSGDESVPPAAPAVAAPAPLPSASTPEPEAPSAAAPAPSTPPRRRPAVGAPRPPPRRRLPDRIRVDGR